MIFENPRFSGAKLVGYFLSVRLQAGHSDRQAYDKVWYHSIALLKLQAMHYNTVW